MTSCSSLDLNAVEIGDVVNELQSFIGKRIARFVEASPTCLLWRGPLHDIAIDCTPHFVHLCATTSRQARGEVTPFSMLLRKYIASTPVANIFAARPNDRIVHIQFVSGFTIACEFTGRHANVFLMDPTGVILGSLFPPHSLTRPLSPGTHYTLPPLSNAGVLLQTSRFPTSEPSAAIDVFFTNAMRAYAARCAHQNAVSKTRREIARIHRLLSRLQEDTANNAQREQGRMLGELFLQAISLWPAKEQTFTFLPYGADSPVTLTLPEKCHTPSEAAQWHFQQYKKAIRANKIIQEKIVQSQKLLQQLEQKLHQLLAIDPETYPVSTLHTTRFLSSGTPQTAVPASTSGFRQFRSSDGFTIRVGKSAADNHRLTFHMGKGDDMWLHARDVPGAHVLVSCPKNTPLPSTTLHEAAMLALFYSDARRERRGYVHVCLRKFVRPVPHRIGEVTLSSPKSLYVELDETVLSRLFLSQKSNEH